MIDTMDSITKLNNTSTISNSSWTSIVNAGPLCDIMEPIHTFYSVPSIPEAFASIFQTSPSSSTFSISAGSSYQSQSTFHGYGIRHSIDKDLQHSLSSNPFMVFGLLLSILGNLFKDALTLDELVQVNQFYEFVEILKLNHTYDSSGLAMLTHKKVVRYHRTVHCFDVINTLN
jgi:hypothetical protein